MAGFYHDAVKPSRLPSICAPRPRALRRLHLGHGRSRARERNAGAKRRLGGSPAGDDLGTSLVRRCGVRGAARAAEGHPGRRQHLGIVVRPVSRGGARPRTGGEDYGTGAVPRHRHPGRERGSARRFIAQKDWTYPSVFDPDGSIRDHLGFPGQPDTVFYGRDGAIVATHGGEIDAETLRRTIDELLA